MNVIKPILTTNELIKKENIYNEFTYSVDEEKSIENIIFDGESLFEVDFFRSRNKKISI